MKWVGLEEVESLLEDLLQVDQGGYLHSSVAEAVCVHVCVCVVCKCEMKKMKNINNGRGITN